MPKSMVIIGSGAVGVEFASIYRSFGAEVTVIEMLPRLVPVEDEDVSKELLRSFKKKGINCFVNTKVEKVEKTKDGVSVSFTPQGEATQKLEAEKVLVAVGRGPNTEGIGLEKTPNIKVERGFVHTNEWMRPERRAFTPSATSLPACRSLRTWAPWRHRGGHAHRRQARQGR